MHLSRTCLLLFLLATVAVADFGGGETGGKVPTTQPTTSQPTGFKAPSVPGELLQIPLVDLTPPPSPPAELNTKNGQAGLVNRYESDKAKSIPGSPNINQELESESATAMTSVAYIFATFVALLFILGSLIMYRGQRDHRYNLVSTSTDSHEMGPTRYGFHPPFR